MSQTTFISNSNSEDSIPGNRGSLSNRLSLINMTPILNCLKNDIDTSFLYYNRVVHYDNVRTYDASSMAMTQVL